MGSFLTPTVRIQHEIPRIKNSRFLATVAPITEAAAAQAVIAEVREQFPDSRHHCFAYRLGASGQEYRFSDDGEPSGSAGRPILARLEGMEVSNAVVVVSRWFGGVKLGVGGLTRAYGGAAAAALELSQLRRHVPMARVRATFPYECTGAVQSFLSGQDREPVSASYEVDVVMEFEMPVADAEPFVAELIERTAGRGRTEVRPVDGDPATS